MNKHPCTHTCILTCLHYLHTSIQYGMIYIYIYICVYIYIYINMYVCMHVCIYTCAYPIRFRLSTRSNTAKFVELPLDELEKNYDPQWLQERVVSGQQLNPLSVQSVPNKFTCSKSGNLLSIFPSSNSCGLSSAGKTTPSGLLLCQVAKILPLIHTK